uniref:CMP/dCMP-type deaminase domain-containing protein n=1 Tax=viral metagenome TaxID=1070528 RepID=A0A6C0C3U4_9ZZZZ
MKKLTIYIARYKSSTKNISGHSAPCSNCLCKIKELGIKKIVYVNAHGQIIKCLARKFSTNYVSVGYREYARQNITVQ